MEKVNAAEAAALLTEYWSQEVVGRANGNLIKVAKGIGSTNWHRHNDQGETLPSSSRVVSRSNSGLAISPWTRVTCS